MTKSKNQPTLNKVVVDVVTEAKVDKRKNNPGRPVNKKSARYKRLAKQAFYYKVKKSFVNGKAFNINDNGTLYKYDANNNCIVETAFNSHCANVSYVGRTKVKAYSFTLGKKVNVELNLKTLNFVS